MAAPGSKKEEQSRVTWDSRDLDPPKDLDPTGGLAGEEARGGTSGVAVPRGEMLTFDTKPRGAWGWACVGVVEWLWKYR